jgi:pseudouridine synthase
MPDPDDGAGVDAGAGERLQKLMARAGVASRRRCEGYILEGRVTVNGRVVSELGTRVRPGVDRVEVDGRPLAVSAKRYYLLYKPRGYLSTIRDPHGERLVIDLVPGDERLFPVGRLDMDSEGLLLLTNDGELTLRLTHPRFEHEKEYRVLVSGPVAPDMLDRLSRGMVLDGEEGVVRAEAVPQPVEWRWRGEPVPPGTRWLTVVLREGRKRQIRKMLASVGLRAERLIRVRMGALVLGALEPGQGRWLGDGEALALRSSVGLSGVDARSAQGLP